MTEGRGPAVLPRTSARVWIERPHGSAGCGGRHRRQHLGELLFEFSFWSAIYLPPFQQHRPLAYGCHRPTLGTVGNVASIAELTPVNVQRMYAESQLKGHNDPGQ